MIELKYTTERLTESSVAGYMLKDYGSESLVSMYKDYDVFFAHLRSIERLGYLEDMITLRPLSEWSGDDGDCLWWDTDEIEQEPMYVGSPIDTEWDESMKWYIQIPVPIKKEVTDET